MILMIMINYPLGFPGTYTHMPRKAKKSGRDNEW